MDFSSYLQSFSCDCGMTHGCGVEQIRIGSGVRHEAAALLGCCRQVLVVSDENTEAACAASLKRDLAEAGLAVQSLCYPGKPVLVPNEKAIEALEAEISPETAALVGVGSGVINDLCKIVSFRHDLPYMIVATAPSMDGFASVGSALILEERKVTLNARVPRWILGDTEILKTAPLSMLRSGIGDMIGKYSCLNDWRLSAAITGERFCRRVYDLVQSAVDACMNTIEDVLARKESGIGKLMEGLVLVGIGMSYMGNSRPASGAEHHLSHFYEITGLLRGTDYLAHGIDVGYATYVTAGLRRRLAGEDPAGFAHRFDHTLWESRVRQSYGSASDGILAMQDNLGLYSADRSAVIREKWPEIRRILLDAPDADAILGLLTRAGFALPRYEAQYGMNTIRESVLRAKDLKDRYTVLWLLQDIGLLEPYASAVTL